MAESDGQDKSEKNYVQINIERNISKGFGLGNIFISTRNLIEACLASGVALFIIGHINFTNSVKGFYSAVFGIGLFWLVARGYKNRSFTQIAVDYFKTVKNRKVLHLRGPEYVRQDIKLKGGSESSDETYAKQIIKWSKGRLNNFIDEYSEEEDSK